MTTPLPLAPVRKLGPGTLTIGSAGSAVDFAPRATSAAVTWKVDSEDAVPVLSGATLAGDRTNTATLEVTILQDDLSDGSLIAWSWANAGTEVPFEYQPWSDSPSITGTVVVDPLDFGGDVQKKNTSDLAWECVGTPTIADNL